MRLGADSIGAARLRRAQVGAAWAVAAHATRTGPDIPAQVILPTGAGKTAVLTLLPFLLRSKRVLVVAPSRLIRGQLADAFRTFNDLRNADVFSATVGEPKVVVVSGRASADDWAGWREADVVVATVQSVSEGYPGARRLPADMFDLALFDEAHHVPADAWTALLDSAQARSVLATATPFRSDQRPLPGEEVYRYPLALAIKDKILAPVRYVPVEVSDGHDKDEALASAAADRLRDEIHTAAASRLLVRTNRVDAAKALVDVYAKEGLKLGVIVGSTSDRQVRTTLQRARHGDLDGFVCVGAMIEGFDFPQLKIAAYHEPHRTLGPTLQFVGRLSRPSGVQAELLAVRGDVEGETRELYESDQDWAELLPGIIDAALDEEQAVRQYAKQAVQSGPLNIPVRAIAPPRQAHVYRCPDRPGQLAARPEELNHAPVIYSFFHSPSDLAAFVTHRRHRPRWLRSDVLDTPDYQLHVVTWVEDAAALFISSDSLTDARELKSVIDAVDAKPIGSEELRRLLWAAKPTGYHAVGLRTTRPSIASHTSYRSLHGRQANRSVSLADADTATVGHAFAFRKGSGGGTLGFSADKGKFWEPASADTFYGYRKWCVERARELTASGPNGPGLPGLPVGLGEHYLEFPTLPLAAIPDHNLFDDLVVREDTDMRQFADFDLAAAREDPEHLRLSLMDGNRIVWEGVQSPEGDITTTTTCVDLLDVRTGELVDLGPCMADYPPTILFGDGSAVFGAFRQPPPINPILPSDMLVATSWSGTTITREHDHDRPEHGTVQGRTLSWAESDFEWIIFDHGSYETADFVCINPDESPVRVALLHCKGSSSPQPGARVEDLYEVAGQCVRSSSWIREPTTLWKQLLHRIAIRPGVTGVLHGDEETALTRINEWAATPTEVEVTVWAVQPGLKAERAPQANNVRTLLAGVDDQLRQHGLAFRVLCS